MEDGDVFSWVNRFPPRADGLLRLARYLPLVLLLLPLPAVADSMPPMDFATLLFKALWLVMLVVFGLFAFCGGYVFVVSAWLREWSGVAQGLVIFTIFLLISVIIWSNVFNDPVAPTEVSPAPVAEAAHDAPEPATVAGTIQPETLPVPSQQSAGEDPAPTAQLVPAEESSWPALLIFLAIVNLVGFLAYVLWGNSKLLIVSFIGLIGYGVLIDSGILEEQVSSEPSMVAAFHPERTASVGAATEPVAMAEAAAPVSTQPEKVAPPELPAAADTNPDLAPTLKPKSEPRADEPKDPYALVKNVLAVMGLTLLTGILVLLVYDNPLFFAGILFGVLLYGVLKYTSADEDPPAVHPQTAVVAEDQTEATVTPEAVPAALTTAEGDEIPDDRGRPYRVLFWVLLVLFIALIFLFRTHIRMRRELQSYRNGEIEVRRGIPLSLGELSNPDHRAIWGNASVHIDPGRTPPAPESVVPESTPTNEPDPSTGRIRRRIFLP